MTVTDAELAQIALSRAEYERLLGMLDREPSEVELGMVSALWSEHCGYKHSRPLFHHFPTTGPGVLTEAGAENAGAIDLGDGWCAVFKMESHNHPSAVEPYEGAATGVGGILRDIFAMGMRPVALLDSLRFGPLVAGPETDAAQAARNRYLFGGVVSGIGGYGNCVGVPTVGGEVQFDPAYSGNPLVNAMCVGVGRREHLLSAAAHGPGNPLVLVGADTGRDGIHGATFASVELDEGGADRRPAVQVGNPFMEKLLMEACVELAERHRDWIEGLQDCGAAGLTSSCVEAADRAGTGIEIDVDRVPRREQGMTAYEVMLSESQERMVVIPKAEHLDDVLAHFRRWELHADVIGRVTDDGMATVVEGGRVVARIPVGILTDPPQYVVATERPAALAERHAYPLGALPDLAADAAGAALADLLAAPNIASRRWVFRQYDHQVLNQTVVPPGGDAAVLWVRPTDRGLAVATDCNARLVELEPRIGAQIAVAEAARNVVATGARPVAVTDCLNFGNPERPEIGYQLTEAVRGLGEACRALGTPVVSGNASLYNETPRGAVLPTPTIGMLGIVDDIRRTLTPAWGAGDTVFVLGGPARQPAAALGGSEYVRRAHGLAVGEPVLDLDLEVRVQALVLDLHRRRLLSAAHDLAEGGLAVAAAECAIAAGVGLDAAAFAERIAAPTGPTGPTDSTAAAAGAAGDTGDPGAARLDAALFGEAQSRFLVSVPTAGAAATLLELAEAAAVPAWLLGRAGGEHLRLGAIDLPLVDLRAAYEGGLPAALAGPA